MKRLISLIILIVFLGLSFEGCVPALIGAIAAGDDDKASRREKFKEHFDELNMKREEKGLKPLDWCDELDKYDQDWAREQHCYDDSSK
jgi:hypothetical protein